MERKTEADPMAIAQGVRRMAMTIGALGILALMVLTFLSDAMQVESPLLDWVLGWTIAATSASWLVVLACCLMIYEGSW